MTPLEIAGAHIDVAILDLLNTGFKTEDVSGALTAAALAILVLTEGREATAQHLVDIAARLQVESS
ncbi:hypothetical protein [Pelagibacterium lentulum]|uniref:Uncharacterized protein n=1 Tax=Pelagibacterium lentulum TaxID=2029865 RepID=A0A916RAT1_9HYPH|nr:hypothetical protein [Pelagibacterium lentulum]GGA47271.1 hypothetical protein GCM10011499_16320 [Pelagibacterium lentulum]